MLKFPTQRFRLQEIVHFSNNSGLWIAIVDIIYNMIRNIHWNMN